MTGYVVMQRHQNDPTWEEIGPPVESVSAEAAIRKAAGDQGGLYVAVPVRSFKTVKVTVETKRSVKLA